MSTDLAAEAHTDNGVETDEATPEDAGSARHGEHTTYLRFAAMIAASTVVMFALTYTNSYSLDHVRWSEERFYMAMVMGGAMAIVMLAFMWGVMYRNTRLNMAVVLVGIVLIVGATYLSRSQVFVNDADYMKGMIPHHSIAILTSERANIDDVRVRELADGIIRAQRREIKEMNWLIDDIAEHGPATTQAEANRRRVPNFTASP